MSAANEAWPRPHRLTVDDYRRMAEIGVLAPDARVELIEGGIVDMAPIGSRHAAAADLLAEGLIGVLAGSAIVRVQGPIRLGLSSEPQPDLAVLRPREDRYATGLPGAGDVLLVIEVSDATLAFDKEVKSRLYARHGIPEFWLLDLVHDEISISTAPRADAYAAVARQAGPTLESAALGLRIDVSALFPPTGAT
jgi:Uma2 family endonuclease